MIRQARSALTRTISFIAFTIPYFTDLLSRLHEVRPDSRLQAASPGPRREPREGLDEAKHQRRIQINRKLSY
jgi:hypothetical protein